MTVAAVEACSVGDRWVRGVGSDDQSGADVDMDRLSGFHGGGGFEQCRKDRSIGAYFIASHVDDDNPKPESLEIMLPLQLSVDGHENVERFLSVGQQRAVLAAPPRDLAYGPDRVARESCFNSGVDTFL